jgi:superfamily I DNA/RNA helicase
MTSAPIYRVFGPPGTGKTHSLVQDWLPWALQEFPFDPSSRAPRVGVASLTKTTAAEVRARIGAALPSKTPTHVPLVSTVHSHAYHAVRLAEGKPTMLTQDTIDAWNERGDQPCLRSTGSISRAAGEHRGDDGPPERPKGESVGDQLLARAEMHLAKFGSLDGLGERETAFYRAWDEHLEQSEEFTFTRLVTRALDLKLPCPAIDPELPGAYLVDEAQDLSVLEFALTRMWRAEHGTALVYFGDPNQAIYDWRGSSGDVFKPEDGVKDLHLARSHRLPRAVERVSTNYLRGCNEHRNTELYVPKLQPRDEEGALHFITDRPAIHAVRAVCVRVREHLEDGETSMVIAPAKYQITQYTDEFDKYDLPYSNRWRPGFRAWNPYRPASTAKRYQGIALPTALLAPYYAKQAGNPRLWKFGEFLELTRIVEDSPVELELPGRARILKNYVERYGKDKHGKDWRDKQVTIEELREWLSERFLGKLLGAMDEDTPERACREIMAVYAVSRRCKYAEVTKSKKKPGYPTFKELDRLFKILFKHGYAYLERDPITVGNIHSVKGGEADHVFLHVESTRKFQKDIMLNGPASMAKMLYVGMTRARVSLTLIYGLTNQGYMARMAGMPHPNMGLRA